MEAVVAFVFKKLGAAVVMPVIFAVLGKLIGIKLSKAIKSGLLVGVGFMGLGLVTGLLTADKKAFDFGLALGNMMDTLGLNLKSFDLGWPAAAAVAYSTAVGAFVIPICLAVNAVLFVCKVTRTVNIDLWNYWHYAFVGAVVALMSGSMAWGFFAAIICFVVTLVMADMTAKGFQSYYADMDGISIPQPFCQSFVPFALAVNWCVDRIPGLNKVELDAEGMKQKFGLLGEPVFLGVVFGMAVGFLSTETFSAIKAVVGADGFFGAMTLAHIQAFGARIVPELPVVFKPGIAMGAVMVLIPRITGLFIEGLKPIAEKTREVVSSRASGAAVSIGMSPALVIGHPTTLVVSILLIPVTILLAVVLPGNKFLPVASLAGIFYLFPCVLPITKGNVVRTFLVGVAAMVAGLYFVTNLAPYFAKAVASCGSSEYQIPAQFESGAALDFAAALQCWVIYHGTVTLKWIGAGLLVLFTVGMCAVNFVRIRRLK